jgi:hypothetical protein
LLTLPSPSLSKRNNRSTENPPGGPPQQDGFQQSTQKKILAVN